MVTDLTKTPANVISDGFGAFFRIWYSCSCSLWQRFLPMVLPEHQERFRTAQPDAYHGWRYDDLHALDFLGSPAGVLLFWGASSVIGILQQQLTMRHLKRVEAQAEAARIEVEPSKLTSSARPRRSVRPKALISIRPCRAPYLARLHQKGLNHVRRNHGRSG